MRIQKSGGKLTLARVAVTGLTGCAFRAHNVERALEAGNVETAAANLGDGVDPNSDMYASGEYRVHLARIHAARAIAAAVSRLS